MSQATGAAVEQRGSPSDDGRRFFVVTSGRTGSTLLCAILADCGAGFAMPTPPIWDTARGDMEHPELRRGADLMRRAYEISPERPPPGLRRVAWSVLRSRAKARLKRLMRQATYVKGENLDLMVQPAFKLGYTPTIILSYRRFEETAISASLRSGHATLQILARYYERLNRNALLLLSTFGGCVVGYEQLVDLQDVSWAAPLASVTGLAVAHLIEARSRRVQAQSPRAGIGGLDRGAADVFEMMNRLRAQAIGPSAQSVRAIGDRRPAADGCRPGRSGPAGCSCPSPARARRP